MGSTSQVTEAGEHQLNFTIDPPLPTSADFTSNLSRVSTPQSNMSDSDDNNNNELALQGFERFRENSINSIEAPSSPTMPNSPPPSDSIAEYCAESLYSYSFTPLSRVNKAAKIKRQILNRGMDYMQRIRWRTGERDTGRRFSQPDIGVLDQTHDWVEDNEANVAPHSTTGVSTRNLQLKTCPSLNDIASSSSHQNGYASNPISPMTPSAPPNTVSNSPHTSNAASASNSTSNLLTASGNNVSQDANETEDDGFHLGRRQTIEVFNNLPPIYEVPKPSTSMITTSAQYTRALHAPSRFLPQNQAILTTDSDATILLFNDMASLCFGIDKSYIGKSILDALEEPFKKQMRSILKRRKSLTSIANQLPSPMRESRLERGLVLVCGIVVPIRKMNEETSSAASLWLKEKLTDEGKSIYIWIFEEIYETSLSTKLDEKGNVVEIIGTTKDLFGYEPSEVIGKPITQLIPALSNGNLVNPGVNLRKIDKLKFYGGRSKSGTCFPTMVNSGSAIPDMIKIVSLPSVAGLITVHNTGRIQSINPVPAKYLFGYSPDALVEKFNIDQIIPQFSSVVAGLRRCNLLQFSSTVNNHACRWALSDMHSAEKYKAMEVSQSLKSLERHPSISANGQMLPTIYAVHRDGSQFEVQLQLRLIESEHESLISIWVTYDRIYALKRAKRLQAQKLPPKPSLPPKTTTQNSTTTTQVPTKKLVQTDQQQVLHPHPLSPATPSITFNQGSETPISPLDTTTSQQPDKATEMPIITKKRPPIRPYGISSFGSVDQKKALFPGGFLEREDSGSSDGHDTPSPQHSPQQEKQVASLEIEQAEKTKPSSHPMDAYAIVGTLGEGAYGTAKLAYRKDDITKTKVVIKFIAKSRIIIDSWIRDRKLGLIPLEIHILKKLKECPQANCCALETYMEDEDNYFVVMKLHGLNSMDLFDYIELNEHIKEDEIKNIFKQVALAVKHIQELRIVHRDIKDENILLDENGCVHLIDFGSAAYFRKGRTFDTFGGTLDYCAPEILKGMPYEGPPQDIWSLGTLLYTLIYRENPFYNVDEIMEHDLRIPFVLSEDSLDLIKKMLNRDVEKRLTIDEVLAHPWLKSCT
ncbi:Ser/Thr protein kinase [Mucor ambiguus]|uniref:Ser/Thr protein kinase n=1 Tax=Mucor ambiguus TaxID=91626 RepID=A0A0C9LR19_9FUNG|nr:Ser/Thr protein kinase [Mucor ambiguus]